MGPQLYRCGNLPAGLRVAPRYQSFNGAATLSLWKPKAGIGAVARRQVLQWGRNFIVAETDQCVCRTSLRLECFNGAATLSLRKPLKDAWRRLLQLASMGPQLYRCGNFSSSQLAIACLRGASMGPQLYRCGNKGGGEAIFLNTFSLQWGRNFIVAETSRDKGMIAVPMEASMGPQLYRCGNRRRGSRRRPP